MEEKLKLAEQEALRATLMLREREDAQRKAQTEVEALFRNLRGQAREARAQEPPGPAPEPALAALMGRIGEIERRIEEAEADRDRQCRERRDFERNILEAMRQIRRQWHKSGGPELLVEAALEDMVEALRQRDAAHREMAAALAALKDEPPHSSERVALHAHLEACRDRAEEIQKKLNGQMAIVQAWTKSEPR